MPQEPENGQEIDGFSSATLMIEALRARKISARELLELHLGRIDRYNEALNVIVTRDDDRAREAADLADRALERGEALPLTGLSMTVKDAIDVAGLPTTNGSPERKDAIADENAPTIGRLRGAGAIVMGKTNVPSGGDWQADNPLFGRTNNPWNPEYTSGGSTGGAAAIATGLSPLEIGSDIGGSLRIPAAFCGVYSHKPSATALPGGTRPNPALSLPAQGPIARSPDDLELALNITAGPVAGEDVAWRLQIPQARGSQLSDFRVAILPRFDWLPVDDETQSALEELAGVLGRAGATVSEISPPGIDDGREFYWTYLSLLNSLSTRGLPADVRERSILRLREAGDDISLAKARGMEATVSDYILWHEERERYREAFRSFFRDWDLLLTPVTVRPAFRHNTDRWLDRRLDVNGESVLYDLLSAHPSLATFAGQPATSFPAGRSPEGLPLGLQAIGPYLEDRTTIRFAELIGQEFGGYMRPPGFDDSGDSD